MYIAGQKDMHLMDQFTMNELGLPGTVLMENAGARVVEEIVCSMTKVDEKIIILAGAGNNGGDGFVIARRLHDLNVPAQLWLLADPKKLQGDAKVHFQVYEKRGLPVFYIKKEGIKNLKRELEQASIIVDAMIGTGVKGEVKDPFKEVINLVNQFAEHKLIIAVDIPSGLSSDDGKVQGIAIKATKTITFVFPKKGFFLNDGPKHIGEWKAVDISVPPNIVDELRLDLPELITFKKVKRAIPKRISHGHKGTFGHVLVIGGSRSYIGAPLFTAKAALATGAGLVTLAIPESIYPIVASQYPESLYWPIQDEDGHFAKDSWKVFSEKVKTFDCIAIGPGLSRFPEGEEWIASLINELTGQMIVLDADGLYLVRNQLDKIRAYPGDVIFTPHPGEMATLMKTDISTIENNRLEIAKIFAKDYQVYLLLKGHRTVIATPEGKVFVNPHGNDALGKGGSGDVLTGMIASFLAQGAAPQDAMISGAYLHAKVGEEKAKVLSRYSVTPEDIINGIGKQLLNMKE